MSFKIEAKPQNNELRKVQTDYLKVYESSLPTEEPLVTLSMVEGDTLTAGMRLDEDQAYNLVDALLRIVRGPSLEDLIDDARYYAQQQGEEVGYREGFNDGYDTAAAEGAGGLA